LDCKNQKQLKGQTQCQRLPHEWGLGKGITEVKSYLRRNSAERNSYLAKKKALKDLKHAIKLMYLAVSLINMIMKY
jgi:hypothetical protein